MDHPEPRPIWYDHVPPGFWRRSANRRAFMEWLERKLDVRKPEDWYELTSATIRRFGGRGLLQQCFGGSALALLQEYLPWYDWKEWLFPQVPRGFWMDLANCRRYLEWLGEKLGFDEPEDWYCIDHRHFNENRGATLLARYGASPSAVVKTFFPEHDWKEWLFHHCPRNFWADPANHRRYLEWLGGELGFENMEDWYQIKTDDLMLHRGASLLCKFDFSPIAILMSTFPEYPWQIWKFRYPGKRFWGNPAHCRAYLDWLGTRLGYTTYEDWYQVTYDDFSNNHGLSLISQFQSLPFAVMREYMPEYDWKEWLFQRVPRGFWSDRDNRRRYLEWLAEKLGVRDPEEWNRIGTHTLIRNHGKSVIRAYGYIVDDLFLDTFAEDHPAIRGILGRGRRRLRRLVIR